MRKSLIVIASALILAVAAATHERLRYDSTVFAEATPDRRAPRAAQMDYPPCVRGVREDRCIQLYERGVRRSYERWLAENGRGSRVAEAPRTGPRSYRPCRSRDDDRCQQRAGTSRVAARPAPANRRTQAHRAAAQSRAAAQRPAVRTAARPAAPRVTVRRNEAPAATRPSNADRPRGGTPGI